MILSKLKNIVESDEVVTSERRRKRMVPRESETLRQLKSYDYKDLYKFEVQDLPSAREFLAKNNQPIELINVPGSMRYYGILVLNYMFKSLQQEFPQIKKISYDFENDQAAYDTAKKLNIKTY